MPFPAMLAAKPFDSRAVCSTLRTLRRFLEHIQSQISLLGWVFLVISVLLLGLRFHRKKRAEPLPVGETGEANARAGAAVGYLPVCTSEARKTGDTAAAGALARTLAMRQGRRPLALKRRSLPTAETRVPRLRIAGSAGRGSVKDFGEQPLCQVVGY